MADVSTQSAAVSAMAENWPLINALLGGTPAMRRAGAQFLPQWPNEPDSAYKSRLNTATLFPAFARTVDVLVGKPFSKPLTLHDDLPERIKEWAGDIDLQGRNLHNFAADIAHAALSHGIAGILVDYPPAEGVRTKAQEKAAGLRPYFVQIKAEDVLGWRSERINGVETLTQLRLMENITEAEGDYGEKPISQVRVLYPGRWEVWRKKENPTSDDDKWIKVQEGVTSLQKIPFIPVYGKRLSFMVGTPPLLELAHMNVEHWQSKSDQQTILHVARVPILFGKNLGADTPITVGASSAILAEAENADLKFVEHSGQAIEAGRLSLLDLEDRMRQVGAELLVIKPGNTSVSQTLADNEPAMCALQKIVHGVQDALNGALALMAEWVGEKAGSSVEIYQDFGVATLHEATMALLREMNVDGTLSDETLFLEAQRRGIIRPEIDWTEESTRIKAQTPKNGTVGDVKLTD